MMATQNNALVPVQQRKPLATAAAIDNKKKIDVALDYSFRAIAEFSEVSLEEPRNTKSRQLAKDDDGRYDTPCIRLNNNCIRDMKDLDTSFKNLVINPTQISWLDLSCNEITTIDPIICNCEELKILNLHGNSIENILDVKVLKDLPRLFKLSLHGNPIDSIRNYRSYVITELPNLKNLDFSLVTKADKATASTWQKTNPPMKGKKKSKKDAQEQEQTKS